MKKRKSGHIIFISSLGGIKPTPFMEFYTASKFAIEGLVGSLAPFLRCFNIRVTSVEPGPVKTSLVANMEKNNQGRMPIGEESKESDDENMRLMKTFFAKYFATLAGMEQTGTEVGEVIKKCIYEKNPPVRIQTSDGVVEKTKEILVDHTGNQVTDELEAFFK